MPRSRALRHDAIVGSAIAAALTVTTLTALATPAAALTVTFFVASSGNDAHDCSSSQPCLTVQRAVNRVTVDHAAKDQDVVINVGTGTYSGATIIAATPNHDPASLTITGAGAGATTLVGGDLGGAILALAATGTPYPVAVQRLSITAPTPADKPASPPGVVGADGVPVYGVFTVGSNVLTISDARISGLHGGRGGQGGTGDAGQQGGLGGAASAIASAGGTEVRVLRAEVSDIVGGAAGSGGASTLMAAPNAAGGQGGVGGSGGMATGVSVNGPRLSVDDSSISGVHAGPGGTGGDGGPGGTDGNGGVAGQGGRAGDAKGIDHTGDLTMITDTTVTDVAGAAAGAGGTGGPGDAAGGPGGAGGRGGLVAGIYGEPFDDPTPYVLSARHVTVTGTTVGPVGGGGTGGTGVAQGSTGTPGTAAVGSGGIALHQGYSPTSPFTVLQLAANLLHNPGLPNCTRLDDVAIFPVATSDGGYNVASDATCFNGGPGNRTVANLGTFLGPLAGNGGLTRTIALIGGTNPAVRAVTKASGLCGGTDQRGSARPGLGAPNRCAAGAFEPQRAATCHGKKATIQGTAGKDKLVGTSKRDIIAGLGGRDVILGLGGNDLICGGFGRDALKGGRGKDSLYGGQGADTLVGGSGRDVGSGGPGTDRIRNVERQP